jgi:crotonobetaine/carnitine-CoA ligase
MQWTTLGALLEVQARKYGEQEFVHFIDTGERLTYEAFNERCNRLAHGLVERGVRAGDFIAIMLRNSVEYLVAAYALKKLGAVEVSLNIDFRGRALVRTVNLTASPILITSNEFLEPLARVGDEMTFLRTLVFVDEPDSKLKGCEHLGFSELLSGDTSNPAGPSDDTELAAILFTSGSTGFSKGLQVSHRYMVCNAALVAEAFTLNEQDRVYTPWPLHHYGAAVCEVACALLTGGSVVLRSRLSVSRFWDEVRETGATWAMMMGGSQKWLWDRPPDPKDRAHNLRFVWGGPFPVDRPCFEERFGLKTGFCYGLSDIGNPCIEVIDDDEPPDSCGKVRTDLYDIRIFNVRDEEVAAGETGEIVCRPKVPGIILQGYYGQPEYTLEAFRNLWFHTGDLGQIDADGYLYFVDRKKQVLRHSGENILPAEVEEVINAHPAVHECVVVGVPNDIREQDVAVFIVLHCGQSLSPEDIRKHCSGELAHYMIPSIIRVVDEIPLTSTEKPALGRLLELLG